MVLAHSAGGIIISLRIEVRVMCWGSWGRFPEEIALGFLLKATAVILSGVTFHVLVAWMTSVVFEFTCVLSSEIVRDGGSEGAAEPDCQLQLPALAW